MFKTIKKNKAKFLFLIFFFKFIVNKIIFIKMREMLFNILLYSSRQFLEYNFMFLNGAM